MVVGTPRINEKDKEFTRQMSEPRNGNINQARANTTGRSPQKRREEINPAFVEKVSNTTFGNSSPPTALYHTNPKRPKPQMSEDQSATSTTRAYTDDGGYTKSSINNEVTVDLSPLRRLGDNRIRGSPIKKFKEMFRSTPTKKPTKRERDLFRTPPETTVLPFTPNILHSNVVSVAEDDQSSHPNQSSVTNMSIPKSCIIESEDTPTHTPRSKWKSGGDAKVTPRIWTRERQLSPRNDVDRSLEFDPSKDQGRNTASQGAFNFFRTLEKEKKHIK
jgi:hypothetical protein